MDTVQSIDHLLDKEIVERVLVGNKESYGILFERISILSTAWLRLLRR